eukprot:1099719-Lingulodinium_polyedra.AAC.1
MMRAIHAMSTLETVRSQCMNCISPTICAARAMCTKSATCANLRDADGMHDVRNKQELHVLFHRT